MVNQNAFVKLLHDRRLRIEIGERLLDSLFPFGVRQIGAESDAATAPAQWRKSTDFQ